MSLPADTLGAEQWRGCKESAAFHTRILTVVAVVRTPAILAATPQGPLCPLTGDVIQPDIPSAWIYRRQGERGKHN